MVEPRMKLLGKVVAKNNTHSCPECNKGTYCAMLDGKSGSACWCMGEVTSNATFLPLPEPVEDSTCLCRNCLTSK